MAFGLAIETLEEFSLTEEDMLKAGGVVKGKNVIAKNKFYVNNFP